MLQWILRIFGLRLPTDHPIDIIRATYTPRQQCYVVGPMAIYAGKPLDSLPAEIMSLVVAELWVFDLKNLRLCSKTLANVAAIRLFFVVRLRFDAASNRKIEKRYVHMSEHTI